MPKRTAKFNRSKTSSNEEEANIEEIEQDEDKDVGQTMLGLDNLKDLIFLGKIRQTVDIAGFKFVVSTLNTQQQREIMRNVMKFDQMDRLLDIKPVTVSYVIETINGVPLEDLCEDEEIEDSLEKRISVIMNLQSVVIEKIYRVYEQLVEASNKQVGLEDLKK
jgi:hypothetical protein